MKMRYITDTFISAYEKADREERKRMLRGILDTWDAEYHHFISLGVSPDTIWSIGIRRISLTLDPGAGGEYN